MAEHGRELRVAVSPGRFGFDVEQAGGNSLFHRLCYSRLFVYPPVHGPDGPNVGDVSTLAPSLAESWEQSADGMTYWVTLKEGVFSPAGNELTSNDVKWGWDRAFALRDVGKWVAMVGSVLSTDDVNPIDRYTIEFRLRVPNPTLLQQLSRSTPTIYDSVEARRHATEADPWAKEWLAKAPAGFGAYSLGSQVPWRETVFQANAGAAVPPGIERVRFIIVPGRQRRLAMLRDGEVDLLPSIEPADAVSLEGAAGVRVSRSRSGAHVALHMNCQIAPFDRREVRQAVARAAPYERILHEVYHGTARRWRTPIPETVPFASDQGVTYEYDPGAARALLADAGLADGFGTELFVDASDAEHVASAEIIAEALLEIGVRVEVEKLDPGAFWAGGRYFRPFPMLIWQDHHQVPDPYYSLIHDYMPGKMGLINCGDYRSDAVASLINRIEGESDLAVRRSLAEQAQKLILDDCPNVMIAQPAAIAAMRDDLDGFFFPPDSALHVEALRFRANAD